ncbi:hypothetical protein AAFC00_000584 [Neodothiora populina]|uniref:Putative gamma-glutamylcyclotransferase n=1 Tax=Neodothiora populina TaxID=2781224 RepID=A0ABR3PDC5_9PEZI
MTEHSAFFYGTLMSPEVLNRVIYNMPHVSKHHIDNIKSYPAILHNHRRHRVRGADYPAVIPISATDGFSGSGSNSSSVRGTYVTGLTSANIYKLDLFEGEDYERRHVRIGLLEPASASSTTTTTTPNDNESLTGGKGDEKQQQVKLVETKQVDAQTYIWIAGPDELEDQEWDFARFRREKLRVWVSGDVYGEFAELDRAYQEKQRDGAASNGV